jgi:hypothetical protein
MILYKYSIIIKLICQLIEFNCSKVIKKPNQVAGLLSAKANIPSGFLVKSPPQLFQRRFEFFDQPVAIFPDPPGDVLRRDAAGDMLRAPARQLQQRRDRAWKG